MLDQLDPHSVYIPVKQTKNFGESFRTAFEGFGIDQLIILFTYKTSVCDIIFF